MTDQLNNAQWFVLIGSLLVFMGLTFTVIKRLPVTSAIIYLAVGMLVGPTVFHLFHFNPLKESALLEVFTEVAVLISLFSAGVKMPVPIRFKNWRAPVCLATVSMTITVALVAAFAYYALDLPLGAGILLGAIVAPTDPVLATDVQIRHTSDEDPLRFTLTCEAGMNDGTAFPFVMLGLGMLGIHEIGDGAMQWLLLDVLWATIGGIMIGIACGVVLGNIGWKLRGKQHRHELLDDFLGLGLIALVYGISLLANTWGFLAVFFAAVALRQTESQLTAKANQQRDKEDQTSYTVSKGSLIFKEHLERLSELVLILLIGGTLFIDSWSWRAVSLALFLFLIARPVSVFVGLLGTGTPWRLRAMAGWFGVRGIGSLYYLMYAIQHGLPEEVSLRLMHLILIVVALSILLHGTTVKPLMARFWR
ncbi:cation:proton antiporter [Neptunicella sp. SCSIO 80796]|uniref:cation:proton antiporter n=1 Tax=Neptunicella plasticusilytica TaxID=3117012 RepID=UPI003A4E3AB2